jgi:ABC-type multidrug transport system fused ATPase/permease subunit
MSAGEGGDGLVVAAPPVPVREIFRRFWPYARRYRKWLAFSLIFIVIGPAIDTAMIWMFKVVVDEVLVPRDFDPLAYNRQDYEVQRYEREAVGSFRATMASMRLRALFTPIASLIELAGALLVIGLGTYKLSKGELSLGGLLAFMTYLTRLYDPIRSLTKLTTTIYSASAGAERVIELLDEQPAVTDRPDARDLGRARGVVTVDNVCYRYPDTDRDAVDDISFTVAPGETLALVGGSGAGKSTLAKLLLRFHEPDAGEIAVDGRDVRGLTLHSLRENIAVLLQETLVFEGTVRENIAYGRPGASGEEIERAARAADAHEFIAALPGAATTRRSASAGAGCRAASASASRSRGRWCATRRSPSSTSRRRDSTTSRRSASWRRCAGSWRAVRRSSSRTTS